MSENKTSTPAHNAEPSTASASKKAAGRATSDVRSLRALAYALPLYGLLVFVARSMPPDIRAILLERGWVCHAIMLLASWALVILLLKWIALRAQSRVFSLNVLPADLTLIDPANVAQVIEHVHETRRQLATRKAPRSFLAERVMRVLEHFSARFDAVEAATVSNSEAEADGASSAASFSIVKVLIWAIPILGFIGTVIGIGDAVGGFSRSLEGAGQLDTIKTALGDVTTGLAVAFDTTLVALVASIFVMLPTSWLQKAEDRLLGDVDDYVVTNVLRILSSKSASLNTSAEQSSAATAGELRQVVSDVLIPAISELLAGNRALMNELITERRATIESQQKTAEAVQRITDATSSLGPSIEKALVSLTKASTSIEQNIAPLERAAAEFHASNVVLKEKVAEDRVGAAAMRVSLQDNLVALKSYSDKLLTGFEKVEAGVDRAALELSKSVTLAENAGVLANEVQDQLCRELGASRKLLELLAAGLGGKHHHQHALGEHVSGSNGSNGSNGKTQLLGSALAPAR
ncbi:MAG: MotA/TolQ/ExbB proton channel family protein [Polyangiaceae bacterium]|nr:MotA/TolQ/ExbB proton channel family protein [Polyangiaceae bacterium]